MTQDRAGLALFDFDGTLCPGDSILPFLRFCIRQGVAPRRQLLIAGWAWLKKHLFPHSITMSNVKARSLSFIRGMDRTALDALADRFWQEELLPRCYPGGMAELRRCREEGCTVLIISASPSVYMDRAPLHLPVDAVLSTRCVTGADGRYTGEVAANCRGDEKPRILRAWLEAQSMDPDTPVLHAYGDTAGDAPMLRLARDPVAANPKKKLLRALPGVRVENWKT